MRKFLFALIVSALLSSMAAADTIISSDTFPDPAFREHVKLYDTNGDNILQDSEIAAVTAISVSSLDISSLEGIGVFTSLQTLVCAINNLTALDLSANTQLETLACDYNRIPSLNLNACKKLRTLFCTDAGLSSLEISGCTALEELYCYTNSLDVLDVSTNTALVSLDCQNNSINALTLSNNPQLKFLDCSTNNITSLNLSGNTALQQLYCHDLTLNSLNVTGLEDLRSLWCWDDKLPALDISTNNKLESLICYGNALSDFEDIDKFIKYVDKKSSLSELVCTGLKFTDEEFLEAIINNITLMNPASENSVLLNCITGYNGIDSKDIHALDKDGNPVELLQFVRSNFEQVRAVFASKPEIVRYRYNTGIDRLNMHVTLVSAAPQEFAPCYNGIFDGTSSGDIISWKGIPYAESPTGSLRWQAPEYPAYSDEIFTAFTYADTPLQHYSSSNPKETMPPRGEECLALNVWTRSRDISALKPVMVWVHGGAFNSGGTGNPDYNGDKFIAPHDDVVLVSVGFRVGIMGFIDFVNSGLPGAENFPYSQNLGLLDVLLSLNWIHENIRAFGGDPENVTVFGQSSGGAMVSLLVSMPDAKKLVKRAIIQSGGVSMTSSIDDCKALTQALVQLTSADTMDKLMALSSSDLQAAAEKLQGLTNFPERDGIIVAADPYEAFAVNSASFDLLIGSMQDEVNYWSLAAGAEGFAQFVPYAYSQIVSGINAVSSEDAARAGEFVSLYMTNNDGASEFEAMSAFLNDLLFRGPLLTQANTHSGNTYVYYWEYPSWIEGIGACHALDIPYVFNDNTNGLAAMNYNQALASQVQDMWVNFAKTGRPYTASITWPEYDTTAMAAMIINDPLAVRNANRVDEYALIQPLLKYGVSGRELISAIHSRTGTESEDITPVPVSPDIPSVPQSEDIVPLSTVGSSGGGCNAGFMLPVMIAVLMFAAKKRF